MAETLHMDLGRDVPRRAREWMREMCATCGLDALADDAELMVSELVTNVFLHAHSNCLINAELGDHLLRVEVADEDQRDVRPVTAADGSERGRGLHIVAALATEWGIHYQPPGKTIWFTLASSADVRTGSCETEAPRAALRSVAAG